MHTQSKLTFDGRYDLWAELPGGWRAIIATCAEGRFCSNGSVALHGDVVQANTERIADCWNALLGIPNPAAVGEVIRAAKLALEELRGWQGDPEDLHPGNVAQRELEAALAKLNEKGT